MHAPRGEGKNVFEKLRVLVIDLGVRRNDGNGIFLWTITTRLFLV